jgi:hypothetical protein
MGMCSFKMSANDKPLYSTGLLASPLYTESPYNDLRSPRTASPDTNTPIHNILSTDPQLSISQKALGTLPEDGNIIPKHVGTTIHNKLNELVYLLAFHAYFYWEF